MWTSRKTDFRSRDVAKNNFSGIDISQGLDLVFPSLSLHFLLITIRKKVGEMVPVPATFRHSPATVNQIFLTTLY